MNVLRNVLGGIESEKTCFWAKMSF